MAKTTTAVFPQNCRTAASIPGFGQSTTETIAKNPIASTTRAIVSRFGTARRKP